MNILTSITMAPLLSWPLLACLGGLALALCAIAIHRRIRGGWWRLGALAILWLALANPRLITEERQSLPDVALVLVDDSPSQSIGDRRAQTEAALTALRERLARLPDLDVRVERVGGDGESGTRLFTAAEHALADLPRRRLGGIFMITDGRVHDVPADGGKELGAPLHALITGHPDERDRRVILTRAPGYALVGKTATVAFRIDDSAADQPVGVTVRVDGQTYVAAAFPANRESSIDIPIRHAGSTVVEIEAEQAPGELSAINNRAATGISGVRDRLKVLLISGEPHAGERAWRNLLKSDPSVDLVHFTILRPPEKDDRTPIRELALITFPVRELFEDKLNDFDLVVFDRYRRRGVLSGAYYQALVDYVRRGGALLAAVGPEYAEAGGLYDSPLGQVLPAEPTGDLDNAAFIPTVTDLGRRHPVTAALPQPWGPWVRHVPVTLRRGSVLLSTPDHQPLLVMDKVGEGRVAQVLSDTIWLWARGFQGGGPHDELLRRLAHWLMKEPELEEDSLSADIRGGRLEVVRRSLAPPPETVTVTAPDGTARQLPLTDQGDGRAITATDVDQPGLWRVEDGERTAVAAAGTVTPLETMEPTATTAVLAPVADATGGSARFLVQGGIPDLRKVGPGRIAAGRDWAGVIAHDEHLVTGIRDLPLLPGLALLILSLGGMLAAWRREGR